MDIRQDIKLPTITDSLCDDKLKKLCEESYQRAMVAGFDYWNRIKPMTYGLVNRFLIYKDLYKKLNWTVEYKEKPVDCIIVKIENMILEFTTEDLEEWVFVNDIAYEIDWLHVDRQIDEILSVLELEE